MEGIARFWAKYNELKMTCVKLGFWQFSYSHALYRLFTYRKGADPSARAEIAVHSDVSLYSYHLLSS